MAGAESLPQRGLVWGTRGPEPQDDRFWTIRYGPLQIGLLDSYANFPLLIWVGRDPSVSPDTLLLRLLTQVLAEPIIMRTGACTGAPVFNGRA